MIAKLLVFIDHPVLDIGFEAVRYDLVIHPPAIAVLVAVRPPGELVGIPIDHAEGVDVTQLVKQAFHPLLLFAEKTGQALRRLGIVHINIAVHHIPVTADHKLAPLVADLVQVVVKKIKEFALARLRLGVFGVGRGCQQAANTQLFKVGLNIAAFHIKVGETQPIHNGLGQTPGINRHAIGIGLGRIEEIGVVF